MNTCWMLKGPSIAVVYVHVPNDIPHAQWAWDFVHSYLANPPGYDHKMIVVCNGAQPTEEMRRLFLKLPNVSFFYHDDSGWEIGAYIKLSQSLDTDLMLCLGGSTQLLRANWLARMMDAYEKHGFGLYGATTNNGDLPCRVHPHVRTTGFWLPPKLLKHYPHTVTSDRRSRFAFEHGPNNLTLWTWSLGFKAWQVTWDTETEWPGWDKVPNGFHRGDQSQILVSDRMCRAPFYPK